MKHLLLFTLMLLASISGFSTSRYTLFPSFTPDVILPPHNPLENVECTPEDAERVVTLLKNAKKERKSEHPIIYFAKQFLGLPYVGHTLESGDREHLIVNLHELDCTTFVEYVLALALCDENNESTFDEFCLTLARIRYRQGRLYDYTSRLHYFTWWATDNEALGLVRDIAPSMEQTKKLAPFTAVQTIDINYMSKHPNLYKHLKDNQRFVKTINRYEQMSNGKQYRYIPKSALNGSRSSALSAVHDGDIIALLTDSDGLDTRHIGIAYWQGDKLYFIHASSLYKKVLINSEPLYDYELKQKKHTGIRVFRMTEGPRTAKTLPFIKKK